VEREDIRGLKVGRGPTRTQGFGKIVGSVEMQEAQSSSLMKPRGNARRETDYNTNTIT
jgi:hypothetical protein